MDFLQLDREAERHQRSQKIKGNQPILIKFSLELSVSCHIRFGKASRILTFDIRLIFLGSVHVKQFSKRLGRIREASKYSYWSK